MKLRAIRVNNQKNSKYEIYVCSIKIKDLLDPSFIKVDYWKEEKYGKDGQGYQRSENISHVRKIKKSIQNNGIDFPTSILLSCRKGKGGIVDYVYNDEKSCIDLNEYPIYLVDGQHRTAGIREAISELAKEDKNIYNIELGAVLLVGLDKYGEMEYFETINTQAKKVSTDLANELLSERAKSSTDEMSKVVSKNKSWIIRGLSIIHTLNEKKDSPWYHKVKMPNKTYNKTDNAVTGQSQLLQSLKVVLDNGFLKVKKLDEATVIVDDFWSALADIFPDAFLYPKKHVIQKTNGIFSLHMLLNNIMPILLNEKKELTRDNFKEILNNMFASMSIEGYGSENENSKFWQSSNRNGASPYRGQGGFRDLYIRFMEDGFDIYEI